MAYRITDECIGCGTCAAECPVDAISEGDVIYVSDRDIFIDGGNGQSVWPNDSIVEE